MKVEVIKVGELETNCYIVTKNDKTLVIDPGDDFHKIKKALGKRKPTVCLLTHSHYDHVGALDELTKYYNIKVNENHEDEFKYKVIKTPGHTKDSLTFYFYEDNIMFTGDFLFKSSYGRTDLGGNDEDMVSSMNLIKDYPDEIIIYPGHGDSSTLGEEKHNIPYYYMYLT